MRRSFPRFIAGIISVFSARTDDKKTGSVAVFKRLERDKLSRSTLITVPIVALAITRNYHEA